MCTQYQRFVATSLLFSILFQSCGGVGWKLAEDNSPSTSGEQHKPRKPPRLSAPKSVQKQESASAGSMVPQAAFFSEVSSESSAGLSSTGTYTPSPTLPQRLPSRSPSCASSSTTVSKKPTSAMSNKTKPRHAVLGKESIALGKTFPLAKSRLSSPAALAKTLQPTTHGVVPSRKDAVVLKSTSSPVASLPSPIGPFALSSGRAVMFSQVAGCWEAIVKESWGTFSREVSLPVACQEDLYAALRTTLQSKETNHTQRRIHILETAQVPGISRTVYVGYLGLRGGMEEGVRQPQAQTDTVHAPKKINRVAISSSQLHEKSDKKKDEECQAGRRQISSERGIQKIVENAVGRLVSMQSTYPADHEKEEHSKDGAKEQDAQELPPNELPTAWHPPFVARETPASMLSHLLQDHLQLHAQDASETLCLAYAPAVREPVASTQEKEDAKLPSLLRVTALSTSEEAQSAVEAYLERWSLETPAGRAVIWDQGQDILKNLEAIKKTTKRSYRRQVLGFETLDVDPCVWNRVLQKQQATKAELKALRGLRVRLLEALQLNGQELEEAGIRTTMHATVEEAELYSSDEEAQQLSDQARRNHAAFVVGIGKALHGHMEELLALLDDAIGTTIAPYIALLSSTPELPDLLGNYTANFLHETDEELRAEMLGSLLVEVVLQFVPLPKAKTAQLNKIKHTLGQAAQRVVLQYPDQLKKLPKEVPK